MKPLFNSGGNTKPVNPEISANPEMPVNPEVEQWEKVKIFLLTIICGIITAYLASPLLAGIFEELFPKPGQCKLDFSMGSTGVCWFELNGNGIFLVVTLGFLASGGSGLWNSILEYLLKIKDLKKTEVKKAKVEYAMTVKQAEIQGAIPICLNENNNEIETK